MLPAARPPQAAPAAINHDIIYRDSEEVDGRELFAQAGAVPVGLEGTLLRNGPGCFDIGGDPLGFFDGHGLVAALSFHQGRAFLRARFVKSALYLEEQKAGRQVRRRAFANLPRGGNFMNLTLGNAVMHDAFYFAGRLHATDDPGYYQLDPTTLATLGEERYGGRVPKTGRMAAVPRVDKKRDRLICYWVKQSPFGKDVLNLLEYDRDWKVVHEVKHKLNQSFGFTHEVAFTDDYYLVPEVQISLSVFSALRGKKAPFDCFRRSGSPAVVHVVPRDPTSGKKAFTVTLPADLESMFHIGNAYQDGNQIVFDCSAYPWADFAFFSPPALRARTGQTAPAPQPVLRRGRIDLATGALTTDELCRGAELPRVNPDYYGRRYRFAYAAGNQTPDSEPDAFVWSHDVVKLDVGSGKLDVWDAGPARFMSQPVFAARPGATAEDDGWVLAWLVNAETARAEVVILDARAVAAGPIASFDLGSYLGLASHCRFEPEMSVFPR